MKKKYYPVLMDSFAKWLARYCCEDIIPEGKLLEISLSCENEKVYGKLEDEKIFIQAILDFISGMTDRMEKASEGNNTVLKVDLLNQKTVEIDIIFLNCFSATIRKR